MRDRIVQGERGAPGVAENDPALDTGGRPDAVEVLDGPLDRVRACTLRSPTASLIPAMHGSDVAQEFGETVKGVPVPGTAVAAHHRDPSARSECPQRHA